MTITALYQLFLENNTICTDTRKITKCCLFFALKGDNFNGNEFAEDAIKLGASFAIIDQKHYKIDHRYILVDDVLKTLQALSTLHRTTLGIPIIALTGSNGKTTTKELMNSVLSKKFKITATIGNLNNHIGVPLTLLSMTATTEIGIIEMGANHQQEIKFLTDLALPDYGLITNFGKAHLEGFGGIEGVIKGKSEMYSHLKAHDKIIFVNSGDELQLRQVGDYKRVEKFGSKMLLTASQPYVELTYKNYTIKTQLTGAYNFNNICVAIAIGAYFKVPNIDMIDALEHYVPTNNRSQIIEKNGVRIILDAYNANPTSMLAALSSLDQMKNDRKIAVLGDMFELGDEARAEHQTIADRLHELPIAQKILIGEHFFSSEKKHETITYFKTFEDFKTNFDSQQFQNHLLLIKGSRGMALERLLNLI